MNNGKKVNLEDVKNYYRTKIYLEKANEYLGVIGYTEHGERHARLTAKVAYNIMHCLGYGEHASELAAIAGYLHDIGNVVHRDYHSQSSAFIASEILYELGMPCEDVVEIMAAVGNHEEQIGDPISIVTSAVILADKADVHRSRVRTTAMIKFDIHDRVNYAARRSTIEVNEKNKSISLNITIDTKISQVMEYFEIFLSRMMICRRAAKFLNCTFNLIINEIRLL
ncbi:MAG: HD domain-containing protein [bacterium]|nr:HD domain-containing protein [bacterium]